MSIVNYILVTGGAGYIGSHTVVELQSKGYTPVIIDDFRNSKESALDGIENITGVKPILEIVDVCDLSALEQVFKKYNATGIIHFAANKAVGESVDNPLMYYQNNVVGLINMLKMAEKYNVLNFVFSSSCTVYGEPKESAIVTEEFPIQDANSPYGATKQFCERIIDDVNKSGSALKMMRLRYFNPVGAHSSSEIGELPLGKPNNLLPYVTQTAIGKLECLTVFGDDYNTDDGTCIRDYIHVVDLAKAHIKSLDWLENQVKPVVETINIGTGKGVSVLDIINIFEKETGQKLNWKFGKRRAGDVEQIYADASKANKVLGWKAEKTTSDAIIDSWNWELKLKNG